MISFAVIFNLILIQLVNASCPSSIMLNFIEPKNSRIPDSYEEIAYRVFSKYETKDKLKRLENASEVVLTNDELNFDVDEYNQIILKIIKKIARNKKYDKNSHLKKYNKVGHNYMREAEFYKIKLPFDYCPKPSSRDELIKTCNQLLSYRSFDGICNNLENIWYGAVETPLVRYLPSNYQDNFNKMRTEYENYKLPDARLISIEYFKFNPTRSIWSNFLVTFGQEIAHDVSDVKQFDKNSLPCNCDDGNENENCIIQPLLTIDKLYISNNVKCINFARSVPSFINHYYPNCTLNKREQINRLTSFLDLSTIYGFEDLESCRNGGQLPQSLNKKKQIVFKMLNKTSCSRGSKLVPKFFTHDKKGEQNPYLLSMELLWHRNHNLLSKKLKRLNPDWSCEKLFQEARRINIALYQNVIYSEFLPNLLGRALVGEYQLLPIKKDHYFKGYDQRLNPALFNEFSTAAFRLHFLVDDEQCQADAHYNNLKCSDLSINLLNSTLSCINQDSIIRGQISTRSYLGKPQMNRVLNHKLFNNFQSLTVKNIMRGRDHGLRPYIDYREACGLGRARSFEDLTEIPQHSRQKLKKIYDRVEHIDLWVGGASEIPVSEGIVGPTFACIIAQQFLNLKRGDRFYFENGGTPLLEQTQFTHKQLNSIKSTTMASIICANMNNMEHITKSPFLFYNPAFNPLLECNEHSATKFINLKAWKDNQNH